MSNNMVIDNLIRENIFLKETISRLNSLVGNLKHQNEEQQFLI